MTIAELAAAVAQVVGSEGGIVYNTSKPDGTSRKLMDVGVLNTTCWLARTPLETGLLAAYAEFAARH